VPALVVEFVQIQHGIKMTQIVNLQMRSYLGPGANLGAVAKDRQMLVSARAEYACLAMMELARHPSDPKPVRLSDITAKHQIPQRFLVQILLQMKAAGLVGTTRGAAGGYRLAKSPEKITLADILGVLDRLEQPEDRQLGDSDLSRRLQEVWRQLADTRMKFLQRITLRDLVPSESNADYVI
jgi:Rrf2 family protein